MGSFFLTWVVLSWWTVLILCALDAVQRFFLVGAKRSSVMMCAFTIALLGALLSLLDHQARSMERIVSTIAGPMAPQEIIKLRDDIPDAARVKLELIRAEVEFRESGTLRVYIDESGASQIFAPGQEVLSAREERVSSVAAIRAKVDRMRNQITQIVATTLFSVLISCAMGLRWKLAFADI